MFAGGSSFAFHASMTDKAHAYDISSVYLMLGGYIVYMVADVVARFLPRLELKVGEHLTLTSTHVVTLLAFACQCAFFDRQLDFVTWSYEVGFESDTLIVTFAMSLILLMAIRDFIIRKCLRCYKTMPQRENKTFLLVAVAVFSALLAFVLWTMDQERWSCHPHVSRASGASPRAKRARERSEHKRRISPAST
jgi:hypothetical protein